MRFAAWMRGMVFVVCLLPIACGAKAEKNKETKRPSEPEPEVKIDDIIVGKGPTVEKGDYVELHYTGTLTDGTQFDSSVESQEPLSFRVGHGQMIRGFDKGVLNMKEGGKRRITVPAALGYGSRARDKIPANSTLIFEVDLLKVTK
jgi:FKBP-type peptidyl-prolyl cis-trans isomerase